MTPLKLTRVERELAGDEIEIAGHRLQPVAVVSGLSYGREWQNLQPEVAASAEPSVGPDAGLRFGGAVVRIAPKTVLVAAPGDASAHPYHLELDFPTKRALVRMATTALAATALSVLILLSIRVLFKKTPPTIKD